MLTLLGSIGYSMKSVPKEGERVFLKSKSNISAGGEPIDATDIITDEIKNNAIKAVQAIPGLFQGGVDVLWDTTTNNIVVLEVNTLPSIRTHLFPFEGQARDVPKEIVDYYFPETKANHNDPLYYFDIDHIFKGFQNNSLLEIVIPDYPKGNLKSLHLIINNVEKPQTFRRKIFRFAKKLQLNGFVQIIEGKSLELVISGQVDKVDEFKNSFIAGMKYGELEENKWKKPVKIGFEIINSVTHDKQNANSKKQYNKISIEYKTAKKEYDRTIKERDYYKDKYENIKNSKVWKAANFFRKFKK